MKLYNADCLDIMQEMPNKSIDMILCDLPYGVTANIEWDKSLIDLTKLWSEYFRIAKYDTAILLMGQQPFVTDLICSCRGIFRYDLIWEKTMPTCGLNANKMPLRKHEIILVFYQSLPTYNPQFTKGKKYVKDRPALSTTGSGIYNPIETDFTKENLGVRYPTSILKFSNGNNQNIHPTQKPVALFEYLIKTYSNEGDMVLDNCMGSGTTGVACANSGRDFIGIEKEKVYFDAAKKRIENAAKQSKISGWF
jgi:site-specific DNA-methyltransferase (adenine-specific)